MRLIPYRGEELGLGALQERVNKLFDTFFHEGDLGFGRQAIWPAVDVIDTPETLQVKAELPGIDPKDIDISIVANTLTIKGEKTYDKEEKGKTWHRRERAAGKFLRTIPLPVRVDAEHVEAIDKEGVLTITMPKTELEKARHIPVKAK